MLSEQGKQLPGYVVREFDDYLKCGVIPPKNRSVFK